MCNGDLAAAPESPDLIAIIHPAFPNALSGRLRLSNTNQDTTSSRFQPLDVLRPLPHTLQVRIHQFGQAVQPGLDNPVLHSFEVHGTSLRGTSEVLDLGVGGRGVVGRTVSITDDFGAMLGQGIIGRI